MAEEVIRMQEGTEAAAEPEKPAEPMGTVISMEAAKPAAENLTQQQVTTQQMIQQQGQEEGKAPDQAPEAQPGHGRKKKRGNDFFHLQKDLEDFTREDWILSRIPEEDLMEYLRMEQKNNEMLRKAKEIKEKRIFTTLQIALSMSAIVAVVALLKDNPTVLVNILYITGIVIALWIWRGKQDK